MAEGIVFQGLEAYKKKLEAMKVRAGPGMRAYLNTTVYRQIQNIQMQRWVSEGGSEGQSWKPLNPRYAEWKTKKYADSPGSGKKMLIATGQLASGVIGPVDGGDALGLRGPYRSHLKVVSEKEIFVGVNGSLVQYAYDVNQERNFSKISAQSKQWIFDGIRSFVLRGQQ
jgi:hypothetical protein